MLKSKKILIGVCGSIAAYKIAFLIRGLIKEGAEVRVVMTASASSFITPLTLATLSKHPVYTEFVESDTWNNHVELGLWADAFVVAPASANTMAKMAQGICDNLLSAVYLSARCPVFIAPAMDLDMYKHPSTVANFKKLKGFGNHIIDAETGELASGLHGTGRMAEPENITEHLRIFFSHKKLTGKKVLITAGPTRESIDPVRFISNHSTGKMGYALANTFAAEGAEVTLVSGPVENNLEVSPSVNKISVVTAQEMYTSVMEVIESQDILVFSAAVADYAPVNQALEKIKKTDPSLTIEFKKNPDIAAEAGRRKKEGQILVGFALETNNEAENARKKLLTKNLDMVVLNSLKDEGAGFGHSTNKISILYKDNKITVFELKSKEDAAKDIVEAVMNKINA